MTVLILTTDDLSSVAAGVPVTDVAGRWAVGPALTGSRSVQTEACCVGDNK